MRQELHAAASLVFETCCQVKRQAVADPLVADLQH